ncbi:hypothetical protein [Raoultibacter massiliensis]|uniref:Uncharacterized protein n=1 Tax=Raoultibacter massiliensis TaxID=1852371 RepID=A0ABV1JBS3_9ACTN
MYDPVSRTFAVNLWTYKQGLFQRLFARRAKAISARSTMRF